MKRDNYNKVKILKLLLLITVMMGWIVIIPNIPYKKPYNQGEGVNLKTEEDSMGGSYVIEGKEKLEKFLLENNLSNLDDNEVYLCGNTPYDEVVTYSQGNPQYSYLNVYGNFVNKVRDNCVQFNVSEWYPVDMNVDLMDTYLWRNKIRYVYYFVILVGLGLGSSIISKEKI